MRRLLFAMLLLPSFLAAQTTFKTTAREDIAKHPEWSGNNHTAYREPTEKLTPAPKGYEPFYLSHYARHGSRWLISKGDYDNAFNTLSKAKSYNKLTPEGEEVLRRVERIRATSVKRLGDLTTVGERQHHGIGRRMAQNFPEIFKVSDTYVDARSTVVRRCILSMVGECLELAAANPKARFHNDTSDSLQYYLNKPNRATLNLFKERVDSTLSVSYDRSFSIHGRLLEYIFNDPQYVKDSIGSRRAFMDQLYTIARNMQSHDIDNDLLYVFTTDELYQMWRYENISWYLYNGNSPQAPYASYSQDNLLRNMIFTADTIVANPGFHGATLRFGHDSCIYPLACLMELGELAQKIDLKDMASLDRYIRSYNVVTMASNIQLVFYRPKKGQGPILMKVLLNEREVSVGGLKTDRFPYYRWEDFRDYFLKKLQAYDALR